MRSRSASTHHSLARRFLLDQKIAEAIEQFNQTLKLDPQMSVAYDGRGFAYYMMKKYSEARSWIRPRHPDQSQIRQRVRESRRRPPGRRRQRRRRGG